ncbi:hypothetical protein Hanom_Chr04g00381141 [Helianthus anomalus]
MHQLVFFLIGKCYVPYVQGLMQNYNRAVGLTGSSLSILRSRGKAVYYILPSSDPPLALLLVRFTEYDDDETMITKVVSLL